MYKVIKFDDLDIICEIVQIMRIKWAFLAGLQLFDFLIVILVKHGNDDTHWLQSRFYRHIYCLFNIIDFATCQNKQNMVLLL